MKNGTQPGANGNAIEQLPQTQNNRENDQTPSNSSFTNNSYLYNSDHNGIRFQTVGSAYQVVFEKTQYANIITDAKGKILDVNSAALKMFGYSMEEITSIKSSYLFDITEEDYERCLNERNLKGNVTIEKLGRTKDGKKFPCEISLDNFTTNQGEELYATLLTSANMLIIKTI